jgi:hypothetical protein
MKYKVEIQITFCIHIFLLISRSIIGQTEDVYSGIVLSLFNTFTCTGIFRWKGENVATYEVSNVLTKLNVIHDANVYGVEISGLII